MVDHNEIEARIGRSPKDGQRMNRRPRIVKDKDELEEKFDQYIGGGVSGLDEKDETRFPSKIFDQSRISRHSEANVSNNESKLINNGSTRNIQLGAGKN